MRIMVMSLAVMSQTRTPGWVDPVGTEVERALAWQEYDEAKSFIALTMREARADPEPAALPDHEPRRPV